MIYSTRILIIIVSGCSRHKGTYRLGTTVQAYNLLLIFGYLTDKYTQSWMCTYILTPNVIPTTFTLCHIDDI